MIGKTVLVCLLPLIILITEAKAGCVTYKFDFKLGVDAKTQQITDGNKCRLSILNVSQPIYGADVTQKPKHGTVTFADRTTVYYQPTAGYKGDDSYAFQWVGKLGGTMPTATTVTVSVTVK